MDTATPSIAHATLPVRHVRFDYPDDLPALWHPHKPEFAAACNALSLGMPYGEPYVIASVRRVVDDLDDPALAEQARAYLGQERQHYRHHRRFNEILTTQMPGLARIEGWLSRTYRWLGRRGSREFNVAFAAGFEAVAYAAARWMDRRRNALFRGADPVASTLFLWHLAEDVEHKSVAHDVWAAVDGSRLRYAAGLLTSFAPLVWFIFLGTVAQLWSSRRIVNPLAWARLIGWAFGFAMEALPTMAITVVKGHHPSGLADPPFLAGWLQEYDEASGTMPLWNAPISAGAASPTGISARTS